MTQRDVLTHARAVQAKHNAGMNLKGKVLMAKAIRSLEIDTAEGSP